MPKKRRHQPSSSPPPAGGTSEGTPRPWEERAPRWLPPTLITVWTLVVHGVFLASSPLKSLPISAFFYGDAVRYLETARRLAEGLGPLGDGLPYRPPLTAWILVPLWTLLDDLQSVALASKVLMSLLSGITYALVYLLLRRRVPGMWWIALLMPLSFGEMVLASAAGSEVVYRLLLAAILLAGWRRPLLAGALHGLAVLTRAEHLYLAVGWIVIAAILPRLRGAWRRRLPVWAAPSPDPRGMRWAPLAALALVAVVLPYSLSASARVREYNAAHGDELAEPLPSFVTVAFYGPLNFAMAQEGEDIFFEWTIPKAPGVGENVLVPTYPPHLRYILHGYELGFEHIADDPARSVRRTAARLGHSLHALAYGWTWRDLPRPGIWRREPVDIAHAPSTAYLVVALALVALGAWTLRREPAVLLVGGALLAYRLLINGLFFPYLRGVLIVSPWILTVVGAGLFSLLGKLHRRAPWILLAALALFHLSTAWSARRYAIEGERLPDGSIVDDRPVTLRLRAYPHGGGG